MTSITEIVQHISCNLTQTVQNIICPITYGLSYDVATDHGLLTTNLDYASSGHTGFCPDVAGTIAGQRDTNVVHVPVIVANEATVVFTLNDGNVQVVDLTNAVSGDTIYLETDVDWPTNVPVTIEVIFKVGADADVSLDLTGLPDASNPPLTANTYCKYNLQYLPGDDFKFHPISTVTA